MHIGATAVPAEFTTQNQSLVRGLGDEWSWFVQAEILFVTLVSYLW